MENTTGNRPFVMPLSDMIKLLRIPFSIFLFPVFLFGLLPIHEPDWFNLALLFVLLHFFIYPASNAYNSYMDQDTESIGGLEKPPVAGKETFYVSIVLDGIALMTAYFFSPELSALLLVYSVISRLYSWRVTRIKKYPWLSLVTVALVQGGFTFMLVNMFLSDQMKITWFYDRQHIYGIIITSLLIGAFYPLTQIYQHQQDIRSGDRTASYVMGIRGTFLFTALLFLTAILVLCTFYQGMGRPEFFYLNCVFFLPGIVFFLNWGMKCFKDPQQANFRNAMKMNRLSSLLLIAGFTLIWILGRF